MPQLQTENQSCPLLVLGNGKAETLFFSYFRERFNPRMEAHKELLDLCKTKVAAKFAQDDFSKWVNHDFIRLSEDILEHTKSYLSPTSLKRIFGKINSDALPKITTLDILAQYIEYRDWQEFRSKHSIVVTVTSESETEISEQGKPKTSFKKYILILVNFLMAASVLLYFFPKKKKEYYSFDFNMHKAFGKAPFTANFTLDVSTIPSDNIFIDFSDPFETDPKFIQYQLNSDSKTISHTYMIPGVYHPSLNENNKLLDRLDIPVYSNGWEYVAVNYHEKERAFYSIIPRESFKQDGIFCVPSTEVVKYKIDTMTTYCMRYLYYKDFNVPSENLRLELKTCNPILSTFKKCTDIEIQLKFAHWNVGFMLFHKGCNGNYSRVQLGSNVLNGIDHDLSMFEVDLNQWQDILVEIKNGTVFISIKGKVIFESKIEGSLGMFQGISINSQESAQLDYLRISSSDSSLLNEEY